MTPTEQKQRGGHKSAQGDSGGALSFKIFPSFSPSTPAPVIKKLQSYSDPADPPRYPFVAHSATWEQAALNHRLLEPVLTLVTLCPL